MASPAASRSGLRAPIVAAGFEDVVRRFVALFDGPGTGGGALAVHWKGVPVVDAWAGTRDRAGALPWEPDTSVMSFSTSKGVSAAVIHRMVDRHELDLDRPVAAYWPDFGAQGKGHVTLRQVLTHQAGLHNVRAVVDGPRDLLDHEGMEKRLAAARPDPLPGSGPGYHAMTFGWLLSGLVRAVTGEDMATAWRRELAEPLGVDDLRMGLAPEEREGVAELLPHGWALFTLLDRFSGLTALSRRAAESLIVPGFEELLTDPDKEILGSQMPAVSGVFTARALATLYTALGGAEVNGTRLLSEPAANRLRIVQTNERDYVMAIPMRWHLGYHHPFMRGRSPRHSFGHYGFGGSGAWVDPVEDLAVAFVTNRLGSATTPIADPRLFVLSRHIVNAVRRAPRP